MAKSKPTAKIRSAYEFIKANRHQYNVRTMCRLLEVAPSGYYESVPAGTGLVFRDEEG